MERRVNYKMQQPNVVIHSGIVETGIDKIEHHVVNNWNKQGILRTTKDSISNWTYANYKQQNNQKTLKEAYASYNRLNSKQIYAFLSICFKLD